MVRTVRRVSSILVVLLVWPQLVSAQWYVSPFVGKTLSLESPFGEFAAGAPAPDTATAIGVSGGKPALGGLGFEIEFQRINNLFRTGDSELDENGEQIIGPNYVQTVTAAVQYGHPFTSGGQVRFRPYGLFGGGLNVINLGTEKRLDLDYTVLDALPPAQQIAIFNCFATLGPNPTPEQLSTCGIPLVEEIGDEEVGYRGVLTFGGGGVVRLLSHVAARADIRYFMSIPEEDGGPFTFWRFTVGVVIHR
jgi:hypothetical protein